MQCAESRQTVAGAQCEKRLHRDTDVHTECVEVSLGNGDGPGFPFGEKSQSAQCVRGCRKDRPAENLIHAVWPAEPFDTLTQ